MTDRRMSELVNDNAGKTDDNETDDPEIIEDEIDTTMTAAEITGQSTLNIKIRSFLELFAVDKNNLILTVINDSNWDKTNNFWKFIYKERPLRNYDTVKTIFTYMTKVVLEMDWNPSNSNALEDAIFDKPKINKHILEAMCQTTGIEYMSR